LKIEPGQTSRDRLFSLEVVACIGACGLAPVICVNGEFHAGVTTKKVSKILDSYRRKATTMTVVNPSEPTAAGQPACRTYPELLAGILDPASGRFSRNRARRRRTAQLRREVLMRPAIFIGAGTCGWRRSAGNDRRRAGLSRSA